MTRIVAGAAKGRTIKVPASGTRPTSERVREALFSRLDHLGYIEGCAVLDLYSGSGALGLEAASRGAAFVECVESSRKAAELIRANASALKLRVKVSCMRVESRLAGPAQTAFDVVFLDPPYDLDEGRLAAVLARLPGVLAPDGVAVVERSSRSPEPAWPAGFATTDERAFGDTRIFSVSPARLDA